MEGRVDDDAPPVHPQHEPRRLLLGIKPITKERINKKKKKKKKKKRREDDTHAMSRGR